MANEPATAPLIGGVTLLERAINYTLGSLHVVTPEAMSASTPCQEWDLRALLRHLDDSMAALHEAADVGHVALDSPGDAGALSAGGGRPGPEVVGDVRDRARQLLGAWTNGHRSGVVAIAGCPLTASIVAAAGAVEIAVHGWDVSEACGQRREIPASLAAELLELVPMFVSDADRPERFAGPVPASTLASPGDRLIAFLGRHP